MPDPGSEFAREGSFAHEVAAMKLLGKRMTKIQKCSPYFTAELQEATDLYAELVKSKLHQAERKDKNATLMVEVRLDLSEFIPEGFGTSDAVIVADGTMEVIDFKYGKGVEVDAFENKQMMIYALGALRSNAFYDIQNVRMTIVQPRLGHVSEYEISSAELLRWGVFDLKPQALVAFDGKGDLKTGDHCRFCSFKGRCSALAEDAKRMAKKAEELDKNPNALSPEETAEILSIADTLTKWLDAVKEHALASVMDGKTIPGYKAVEGRSIRVFTDKAKAVAILKEAGISEDLYMTKPDLQSISALEKIVGKKEFAALMGDVIFKPQGKPTLAPESDKRAALSPKSPDDIFSSEDDNEIPSF